MIFIIPFRYMEVNIIRFLEYLISIFKFPLRNSIHPYSDICLKLKSCFLVGHTKSQITNLPLLFSKSAKHRILFDCLNLPSSEKSQSLAISLTLSALYHAALRSGCNLLVKKVFPLLGDPLLISSSLSSKNLYYIQIGSNFSFYFGG